jgi:hypothetical protein
MDTCWLFLSVLLVAETSLADRGFSFKNLGAFCKNDTPQGTPNMLHLEKKILENIDYQNGLNLKRPLLELPIIVHLWPV